MPRSLSRLYGGKAMRVEPDIAADADPYTGFRIGLTYPGYGWLTLTYGGTTLTTPLVAAMVADASQGREVPGRLPQPLALRHRGGAHRPRGAADRAPVGVAFTTSYSGSLCDTTCLVTSDRDTSLVTTYGYDDVTGLGTPNGVGFLRAVHAVG